VRGTVVVTRVHKREGTYDRAGTGRRQRRLKVEAARMRQGPKAEPLAPAGHCTGAAAGFYRRSSRGAVVQYSRRSAASGAGIRASRRGRSALVLS
jgi:hypothetical protein